MDSFDDKSTITGLRHTHAVDSGETRYAGGVVDFANQINTMRLNEDSHSA